MGLSESFKEYLSALGYWGVLIIVPLALEGLGVYQLVANVEALDVPSWVWFQVALGLMLIIPFFAFDKVRRRLISITDGRHRDLSRHILRVRQTAARAVMMNKMAEGSDDLADKACDEYQAAMSELRVEAEVEGGRTKEAIQIFANFTGFHVTRLLGGIGPILGGGKGKNQQIEMDEYRFMGRLAERADETIQKIKTTLGR